MKRRILYIELKSGCSDNGPAWIGYVEFSKSGQTIYFDNKALKKMKTPGMCSNHYDSETGDEYWVSGVKKNGQDRHWSGSGKIYIDKKSIDGYLKEIGLENLDKAKFDIIEFESTDKSRFVEIENDTIQQEENSFLDKRVGEMNEDELKMMIDYYYEIEQNIGPNKARKDYRKLRNEAEIELEKRINKNVL